jgi:hypothetical protein
MPAQGMAGEPDMVQVRIAAPGANEHNARRRLMYGRIQGSKI